jgi:hypothetical protein
VSLGHLVALAFALVPSGSGPLAARAQPSGPAPEVLLDGGGGPAPSRRDVAIHGDVGLALAPGWFADDPTFALTPQLRLDAAPRADVWLQLRAPVRLRLVDRAPRARAAEGRVLRRTEWDEVADGVAVLDALHARDERVFRGHGKLLVDVEGGELRRTQLGYGAIWTDLDNSRDLDRRRAGLDSLVRVEGRLLEQRAGAELALLAADLAGTLPFGGRIALDWAGAVLAFAGAFDPAAPRQLVADVDDPGALALTSGNRLADAGPRGAGALELDVGYIATDGWRYRVEPFVALAALPGLGRGLHGGARSEFALGARRQLRLGLDAAVTVGDADYDPGYFDVFYPRQRSQFALLPRPDARASDFGTTALPKFAAVDAAELAGVGGRGGLRLEHAAGWFAELRYAMRPGPLGHTATARVGVALPELSFAALVAQRGRVHGFELHRPSGSLLAAELAVPVRRYLDVVGQGGITYAVRADLAEQVTTTAPTGVVTSAPFAELGVRLHVGW